MGRCRAVLCCFFVLSALSSAGCSVYMAATAPPKKDLNVVKLGVSRQALLSEFGTPNQTRTNDEGFLEDTWTFRQGDATGWKVSRAVFHSAADFFTLGMWEVVGTPTEMLLKNDESTFSVIYDKSDHAIYIASASGEMGQLELGQKPQRTDAIAGSTTGGISPAPATAQEHSAEARLTELKQLLDQGQISKGEYDRKRSEIVSGL